MFEYTLHFLKKLYNHNKLKTKQMPTVTKIWSHNDEYSAFTNEKGETIVSLHTLSAIKLIGQLTDKLQTEVKRAVYLKEGVSLRSVAKTLNGAPESNELYKSVLETAFSIVKKIANIKPTDVPPTRIHFLVGSTKEYPTDLHIYARLTDTTVEWVHE